MEQAEVIAQGYRYPTPGAIDQLADAIESSTEGPIKRHLTQFLNELRPLSIGEWEELHTATLDLSPLFVPYVGHVAWGENYRRGEVMAELNLAMYEAGVDLEGELPDHIAPILRYLSVTAEPLVDLTQVLSAAVETMAKTLNNAAADNPYRHLLAATADYTARFADQTPPSASRTEFRFRRKADGRASWAGVEEVGR